MDGSILMKYLVPFVAQSGGPYPNVEKDAVTSAEYTDP